MEWKPAKISVILPIYKAERTLERCLDSVIGQTYANLEMILVDDGSPDRCPEICDRYAQKDDRIRVVHQTNAGVGAARNTGMFRMTGDYLFFVDADDFIIPDAIATLSAQAARTEADITIGNVCESRGGNHFKNAPSFSREKIAADEHTLPQVRYELFYDPGYGVTVWNKLYRTDLLRKYRIVFEEQFTFCEDRLFNTRCFIRHPHIQLVNAYTYYYCTEASTITRSKIQTPIEKSIKTVHDIRGYLVSNHVLDKNEDLLAWFVFGQINQIARNISIHSEHAFREIREFLVAYKKNGIVTRYLGEISSGKHLDGANRESWKRYARHISGLLSRGAYTAATSILLLRFKTQERGKNRTGPN